MSVRSFEYRVQSTNLCMGPFRWDEADTIHESIPFLKLDIDNTKRVLNVSTHETRENRLLRQSSYYEQISRTVNQTTDQTTDREGMEEYFKLFNIIRVLGDGCSGTAFLCEHILSKERVVLKIPNPNVNAIYTGESFSELVQYDNCNRYITESLAIEAKYGQLLKEGYYAYKKFPPGVPYCIREIDYLKTIGIEKEQMQLHPGKLSAVAMLILYFVL